MSTAAPTTSKPPLGKLILRRTLLGIAIMLLILIPAIVLLVTTGQPSATYAAMGTIVGAIAVMAGGVRVGVLTTIVLSLLAPLSIIAGLSPITGAALMALMTLTVGRLSVFGLHRAVMLVPIMLAWPMLAPVPWVPRESLDKINSLLAERGMSLAQAVDTLNPAQSSSGPMQSVLSHALTQQRFDTEYLTWVMGFFFIGAIIPVVLLPWALRKRQLPKPTLATHTRSEAVPYTLTITVLTSVATYYFIDHPKQATGSFLIATILVLTQVGNDIQWKLTIQRVVGTLLGVLLMIGITAVVGAVTYVEIRGIPMPVGLYLLGNLLGTLAIIAKFSPRQLIYYILMAPTTACLNAFSFTQADNVGEQRLVDNLVGAALVILATLITLAAGRIADKQHPDGGEPVPMAGAPA